MGELNTNKLIDIKKIEDSGTYIPAFFNMHVNTYEDLNNFPYLSYKTSSVIFHEYIHYLQDIITTSGLRNIIHFVDLMKTMTRYIAFDVGQSFKIPVVLSSNQNSVDLHGLYQGDSSFEEFSNEKLINITYESNGLIENCEDEPIVQVFVSNGFNKRSFRFGEFCISESLAYLIESEVFQLEDIPNYPYRTIEYICEFIYPEILKNKRNLIAIGDSSLNVFNSGYFFYNFLVILRNKYPSGVTPMTIYDELRNFTIEFDNRNFNAIELYNYILPKTEKNICDYFTADHYAVIRLWIKRLLNKCSDIRTRRNFQFIDLVKNVNNYRDSLVNLVNEFGSPLISNENNNFYGFNEFEVNSQILLFRAIYEIYTILRGKKRNCELKSYCKKHPCGDLTDSYCDIAPWESTQKRILCAFAQFWKLWGLKGKQPLFT